MLSRIINEINSIKSLPISVEDVVDLILKTNLVDRIHLVPTLDVQSGVMCGVFERRDLTLGWGSVDIATITYNANDSIERQRLTCFKELTHIFDGLYEQTDTKDEIRALVQELVSPDGMSKANLMVLKDRLAEYLCLPLAVPEAALAEIKQDYDNGRLTADQIVEIIRLPKEYVLLMLSDDWSDTAKQLVGIICRDPA